MITTTEFENERAGVMRVKHTKGEAHPLSENGDLLIVYLNGGRIVRNEDAKRETIQHRPGDVVWRDRSHHEIISAGNTAHEVVIVEFE
jgi:hypothetical protein